MKVCSLPLEWMVAIIVPLYKNKGVLKDTNSYRGITLLSCMGWLFTSILNDRLTYLSETNKVKNETQAGFRQRYSTLNQVYCLKCIIDLFKGKKIKWFCLFIDYRKAFDIVWRKDLWYKLIRDNVNTFTCNIWVRPGRNLSPLFFAFYVNGLQETLIDLNLIT